MIGSATAVPSVPSVTVWAALSAFTKLTVVPTAIVSSSGSNANWARRTVSSAPAASDGSAASLAAALSEAGDAVLSAAWLGSALDEVVLPQAARINVSPTNRAGRIRDPRIGEVLL